MALLIDLFGYLSVVLHGLTIIAQSMALGGILFLVFLARPLADRLPEGDVLARCTAAVAGCSALALTVCGLLAVAMLMDSMGLTLVGGWRPRSQSTTSR